jgi:thymidylate kinase
LAKLAFWWVDYGLLGYATDIYPSLARSTLVLFDRYYHDLIVDAKRYRYGGPMWAVQLVSRLIPRPDLVILLDAPPEVLYARKQEFPFAEARRQREAYLDLVKGLSNGYVIDASKPLDQVVAEAEQVILEYLARRTARRFGCSNARPQSSFP